MNKKELWDAMKEPTEKSCLNCVNKDEEMMKLHYHLYDRSCKDWLECLRQYQFRVLWKWDHER